MAFSNPNPLQKEFQRTGKQDHPRVRTHNDGVLQLGVIHGS